LKGSGPLTLHCEKTVREEAFRQKCFVSDCLGVLGDWLNGSLPKVLIVEDDEDLIELYLALLDFVSPVVARTVLEAEEAFEKHEFVAVVMDGHVKGSEPITIRLVRQMKSLRPELKIIANSSDDRLQMKLLEAGCSERCKKETVVEQLLRMFVRAA